MAQLGGVGQYLPYPTKGFPNTVAQGQRYGLAVPVSANEFVLPAGGMILVPPGNWYIAPGKYSSIQFLDPVTLVWRDMMSSLGLGAHYVSSDGSNYRIVNPLGTPVGALVTNVGSGYTAGSTTCTASAGGSTWNVIVGGAISTTVTIGADAQGNTGGTNWTYPPVVVFDAPPQGAGVQATGYATISGGAVNSITVVDQGAGYASAPGVSLYPNPLDPNFGSITIPVCTTTLTGAGAVTAILPVDPGTPQTSAPSLTISGSGSSATAVAIMALTITAVTVSAGTSGTFVTSVGGLVTNAAGAVANPSVSTGRLKVRPANLYESGTSTGVIVDGGMFQVAPSSSVSSMTFTMGSTYDVIVMQQVPGT